MGSRMVTFRSLNNPHSHWQSTNSALGLTCDSHSESFGGLNSSSVTSSPKASMDSSDSSSSKPKESSSLSSPQGSSSEAPKPSSLSSPKKSSSSPLSAKGSELPKGSSDSLARLAHSLGGSPTARQGSSSL